MTTIKRDEVTKEPETLAEERLCGVLSSVCEIPVVGAMSPAQTGEVKSVSGDTFVSVRCNLASQDLDASKPILFLSLSSDITVHYADSDDPSRALFPAECNAVRNALHELTGEGCSRLSGGRLSVDAFTIDATSLDFNGGENPSIAKTYTAKLTCRVTK